MSLSLAKLEKLKITAYEDAKRSVKVREPAAFEAPFNPTGFEQSYKITWDGKQGMNSSGKELGYSYSDPSELTFNLLLEGTGADEMGRLMPPRDPVKDQVEHFLAVVYDYNGGIHEPYALLVEWGSLSFPCRLAKADIKYTAFNRDGTPLRAEVTASFLSDVEESQRAKAEQKSSPDLTHRRVVLEGDKLPWLTRQVYGSSEHYLGVAAFNGLDDFRRLVPGHTLLFPPLHELD